MCEKTKKLRFKWEFGDEMVSLHVNQYAYGGRLHIGMINYGEDGPEPFADMTVNQPIIWRITKHSLTEISAKTC